MQFTNTNLQDVIKVLQERTSLVFNYDPAIIRSQSFSGTLDFSSPQNCVSEILFDSPLAFIEDGEAILIFQPEPQTYEICGTIKDLPSQTPLLGVNIIAEGTPTGTQTDAQGYFELSLSSYKNQRIVISYIGYETINRQIQTFSPSDCEVLQLSLDQDMWSEEIVITDYILDGISEQNEYNGNVMNFERLSKHHSLVEHDILKTAQLLPGINSLDESASNLQIRGGTADQNLILWEGAPIYQSGHLFGMISAINPFSIANVNIHKGVFDPKYDNRVGGVVDISITDSIGQQQHGSLGSTLTEAHLNLEVPIMPSKLQVFLSGRNSISTLYNSPAFESYTNKVFQFSKIDDQSQDVQEGFLIAEQDLSFYDWNAKVLFKPIDQIFIDVAVYQNSQNFEYKLAYPDDPLITSDKIASKSEAIKANLDWKWHSKVSTSLSFMRSSYENDYTYQEEEVGTQLADNFQFNDIIDQSLVFSNSFALSKLHFDLGYDYNVKTVNYNVLNDNIYQPYFEDLTFTQGQYQNVFASARFRYKQFNFTGGIRSTYDVMQARFLNSPRASIQYFINRSLKFKAEGGVFHQFINQVKEFTFNGIAVDNPIWIQSTEGDDFTQKANKIAAGFVFQDKGWLFDVEAYYNRTKGLTTSSPNFTVAPFDDFARGSSEAYGLGVLVKKRWQNLNTWVNYSLGSIRYLFPEISERSFAAPNDIRHNLSLVSNYAYKDFQFALVGNFRSGLPFSTPIGVETVIVPDGEYFRVQYDAINDAQLTTYSRLDLNINYRPKFNLLGRAKLECSLSILNLLNRENEFAREDSLEFNDTSEVPELSTVRKSLLPRTPLLMFRVYW